MKGVINVAVRGLIKFQMNLQRILNFVLTRYEYLPGKVIEDHDDGVLLIVYDSADGKTLNMPKRSRIIIVLFCSGHENK